MTEDAMTTLAQLRHLDLFTCRQMILLLLGNDRGHGWKQADLTKSTGYGHASVGMAKDALVKAGMVTEQFPHRDKRVTRVYLTDTGKAASRNMWAAVTALSHLSEDILSGIPED